MISVITPTFNCAKWLPETIESVLCQSKVKQFVIVNDGSTDNTEAVLNRYKDSRIQIVTQANQGEVASVNIGMTRVNQPYFLVLNADDTLLPNYSQDIGFDSMVSYPDWNMINEQSQIIHTIRLPKYNFRQMVWNHRCYPGVGTLYRKEVIKMIGYRDPQFRWVADFDYLLRCGLKLEMNHTPRVLANWRKREGQATFEKSDLIAESHLNLMRKFYCLPDIPKDIQRIKTQAYLSAWVISLAIKLMPLKPC